MVELAIAPAIAKSLSTLALVHQLGLVVNLPDQVVVAAEALVFFLVLLVDEKC